MFRRLCRRNTLLEQVFDASAIAKLSADLFISLHFNISSKSSVHGIETFSFTPRYQPSTGRKIASSNAALYPGNHNDGWNTLLSFYLQREMTQQLKAKDRGCKRARFAVLKTVKCPSVLIEGGFLSNRREGQKLQSPTYREKLALAITQGILRYQRTINRLRS